MKVWGVQILSDYSYYGIDGLFWKNIYYFCLNHLEITWLRIEELVYKSEHILIKFQPRAFLISQEETWVKYFIFLCFNAILLLEVKCKPKLINLNLDTITISAV